MDSVKTYVSLMAVSGNMQQLNDKVSTLLHNLTVGFTYLPSILRVLLVLAPVPGSTGWNSIGPHTIPYHSNKLTAQREPFVILLRSKSLLFMPKSPAPMTCCMRRIAWPPSFTEPGV